MKIKLTRNMSKKESKQQENVAQEAPEKENQATADVAPEAMEEEVSLEDRITQLEGEVENEKKEYMFLMAEFDNYRKRTLKEKQELIKTASSKAMQELLPVVDDFERAIAAMESASDVESLKEGVDLIYKKFISYLEKQQVKAMDSTGSDFNSDVHDAVTTFPAPEESQKGKVIDTVLKGYMINDKVLRHAKVVVGQ
jgi:hypothetical protein